MMVRLIVILSLLLLLASSGILGSQDTYFELSGEFKCPKNWIWFSLQLWELDDNGEHDEMSPWQNTSSFAPHKFLVKGRQYDDAGWEFEVEMRIRHTCSDDGSILHHVWDLGDFPKAAGKTHKRTYNYDIYNKGVAV